MNPKILTTLLNSYIKTIIVTEEKTAPEYYKIRDLILDARSSKTGYQQFEKNKKFIKLELENKTILFEKYNKNYEFKSKPIIKKQYQNSETVWEELKFILGIKNFKKESIDFIVSSLEKIISFLKQS